MASPNVLVVTTSADRFSNDHSHRTGVWLEEFTVPYLELRGRQAELTVVSPLGGDVPVDPRSAATAAQTRDWAEPIAALSGVGRLAETRAADFDAMFLPGGHGPMFDLPEDDALKMLLEEFERDGKIIAALCHGPAGLLRAQRADGKSLVAGRRLTSYTWQEEKLSGVDKDVPFNLQQALADRGANFEEAPPRSDHVVIDEQLITGQNPWSSARLASALVDAVERQCRSPLERAPGEMPSNRVGALERRGETRMSAVAERVARDHCLAPDRVDAPDPWRPLPEAVRRAGAAGRGRA
jgi:putative intracellular protease/amidase